MNGCVCIMGNNRLDLKMMVSSIILVVIVYFIVNIFNPSENIVTILMGTAVVYVYISGMYFAYQWYTPGLFREYDKKYYLKYGEKLLLSKSDKYILKEICYKVHYGAYHKSVLDALKNKDAIEIDKFLQRSRWTIDNRYTFNNVIEMLSEHLFSNI